MAYSKESDAVGFGTQDDGRDYDGGELTYEVQGSKCKLGVLPQTNNVFETPQAANYRFTVIDGISGAVIDQQVIGFNVRPDGSLPAVQYMTQHTVANGEYNATVALDATPAQ